MSVHLVQKILGDLRLPAGQLKDCNRPNLAPGLGFADPCASLTDALALHSPFLQCSSFVPSLQEVAEGALFYIQMGTLRTWDSARDWILQVTTWKGGQAGTVGNRRLENLI